MAARSEAPETRIVIVAYGGSERLDAALEGAAAALEGRRGEIVAVLAPGDPAATWARERGCEVRTPGPERPATPGANRNLGAEGATAPWLCFVDGDVTLAPDFVQRAIAWLEAHSEAAGVAGRLHERQFENGAVVHEEPDLHRMGRGGPISMVAAAWVARREAFEAVGGFDPRLPSEEDAELSARLLAAGHSLHGLDALAGFHDTPRRPTLPELSRRWRAGLFDGQGLVLRHAWGTPLFGRLLWRQRLYLATLAFTGLGALSGIAWLAGGTRFRAAAIAWALAALLAWAVMTIRKRSPRVAALSLLTWLLLGAGIVRSWVMGRRS